MENNLIKPEPKVIKPFAKIILQAIKASIYHLNVFLLPCHYISLETLFIIFFFIKIIKARSICTYGRARTCVIILGTASLIYNIPRFLEVTWTTQEVCGMNRTIPFATELRMDPTYVKYA